MGRCGRMAVIRKNQRKDIRKLREGGILSLGPGVHRDKIRQVTEMLAKVLNAYKNPAKKS